MLRDYFIFISTWFEPIFFTYYGLINLVYTVLLILGCYKTFRRIKELSVENFIPIFRSESLPDITFLMPAYNEAKDIVQAIDNLLSVKYSQKKIIIINDGSTDKTLELIEKRLNLVPIPHFFKDIIPTKPLRGVFRSLEHPEIRVIDKENGMKFDAINAGLNACESEYFITFDADTRLDSDGFDALIRPILTSPTMVATGASVRILNGCKVSYHQVGADRLPPDYVAGMQSIEYLRSFMMRQGWDFVGGNCCISGAFTLLLKKNVVAAGGFAPTVADDLEMILRMNHVMLGSETPYETFYIPDPVVWTEGPTTIKELGKQRLNWQRGSLESIWFHIKMLFNPRYKLYGFFPFPFLLFGEVLEPVMECLGILYILVGLYLGAINQLNLFLLFMLIWGFNFIYTVFCLLIDELSYRKYGSIRTFFLLVGYSFIEILGFRQLTVWWRLQGTFDFFRRFKTIQKDRRHIVEVTKKAIQKFKGEKNVGHGA